MAAAADYGSILKFGTPLAELGKCIVTGFPEMVMDEADTTNHSGGGYAESIPTGLVRVGDITLSLLAEATVWDTIRGLCVAKTVDAVEITNGMDTITGDGWIRSVKYEDADATDPNALKLTVVIACTGAWT